MSVTRLEIARREPVLNGAAFGAAGPYEKIAGVLHFEVDPDLRVHETIADLERAPAERRGTGRVLRGFLSPSVPWAGGSRRLLLDVPNRGRKIALGMFNSTPAVRTIPAPPGRFRQRLSLCATATRWRGWAGNPMSRHQDGMMALTVPHITGVSRPHPLRVPTQCSGRFAAPRRSLPHIPHPVAQPDDPEHELTVRAHGGAPELPVAAERLAICAPWTEERWVADPSFVSLTGGFEPGKIYDCYLPEPRIRPVVGLGFTPRCATTAAFFALWNERGREPRAPVNSTVPTCSASRRADDFLRHMLYLALDEDEGGRAVFDAVIPHVAGARRGEFKLPVRPALAQCRALDRLPLPVQPTSSRRIR